MCSPSPDTIFTVFVTIFIFIAGYIANRIYDRHKRKKELETLQKYFCYVIQHIDEPIKKQVDHFSKFARDLKNDAPRLRQLTHTLIPELENIKQIKHSDLYDIFLGGKSKNIDERAKSLKKFQESIHLIEYLYNNYQKRFKDFSETLTRHEKKWDENISLIVRHFDEVVSGIVKNKTLAGQEPLIEDINLLIKKISTTSDYKLPKNASRDFIGPLIELCKKHIGDGKEPFFLNHAMKCNEAYANIQNTQYVYRRYFLKSARSLNKARIELYESIKVLN